MQQYRGGCLTIILFMMSIVIVNVVGAIVYSLVPVTKIKGPIAIQVVLVPEEPNRTRDELSITELVLLERLLILHIQTRLGGGYGYDIRTHYGNETFTINFENRIDVDEILPLLMDETFEGANRRLPFPLAVESIEYFD
ncbi:MAG: hypothetical protein ACOYL5_04520 [Phototrophicaceae bacterium]